MSCGNELTVSVVITVYNGEKYLAQCLESVLAQTLKCIEIICVDDASTDATPRILDQYKDRITVLTNLQNCMAGESRNKGFGHSRGEYVIFLDADDVFEPDMLEKAYQKAQYGMADICIFKEDLFTDSNEKCSSYPYVEKLMQALGERDFFSPLELREMLFNLWNGWAWDKLFRREFIMGIGLQFQNLRSSNDGLFVHGCMASAQRIALLNEVMVHHRFGNQDSLSHTRDCGWESCLSYLEGLRQYLEENALFRTYERSYVNWTAEFLYWNYRTLSDRNRKSLADRMRQFFIDGFEWTQYDRLFCYNAFSRWFVNQIIAGDLDKIPVMEETYFEKTYQINASKMEALYRYLDNQGWNIAIWGAGIRGRAFARVYGKRWSRLQKVYDMDKEKKCQELSYGLVVDEFEGHCSKTECILILNAAHVWSVREILKGQNVVLFDMNTYLTLPFEIEDCLLDCRASL